MSKLTTTLLAVALGAAAMSVTVPASARDNDDRWEHRGHGRGHAKHGNQHYYGREVIHERVIVQQPPHVVYERQGYYGPPAHYYRRDPAIVIGVDVPPLVIPLH